MPVARWSCWCRRSPSAAPPRRPGGDPAADRRRLRADRPGAGARLDLHHRGGRPAGPAVIMLPVGAGGGLAGLVPARASIATTAAADRPGWQ